MPKGTIMKALLATTVNLTDGSILVLDPGHRFDNRARYPDVLDPRDVDRLEREELAEVYDGEVPPLETSETRRAAARVASTTGIVGAATAPARVFTPPPLGRDETGQIKKLIEDHTQKDLVTMAEGLPGVDKNSNKAALATAIVAAGRAVPKTVTTGDTGNAGQSAAGGSVTGSTGTTAGSQAGAARGSVLGGPGVETEAEAQRAQALIDGESDEDADPTRAPTE